jgi:hypothetical protein
MKDLNSFFEGAVNSKFLANDNILKKEAARLEFGKILSKYLETVKKDYSYYNNYTQLIRSMARLQLVDLSFFNEQAKITLSNLNQFNHAHNKALPVLYQSYIQLPLSDKTEPDSMNLVQKILKEYILSSINQSSPSDLLNIIRSIYLQSSLLSDYLPDPDFVLDKLKSMLQHPETTSMKPLDIHMLAHLLIVMNLKERSMFDKVLQGVSNESYQRFLHMAHIECLKKMGSEGNEFVEYFQEKVKQVLTN